MDAVAQKLSLRIDWSELDYFGHVNNVSFFKYIQAARVHYWDAIGLREFHLQHNIGPLLASCKCDFKKPLHFPGMVHIATHTESIGNTSFVLAHVLTNNHNETVAIARDVMVVFDFIKNHKVPFPTTFKLKIESLEGKTF